MHRFSYLLLLLSINLGAQVRYVRENIPWNHPLPEAQDTSMMKWTSFRYASYGYYKDKLPYFHENREWPANSIIEESSFFRLEYQELPETVSHNIIFETLDTIPSLNTSLAYASGVPWLSVSFIPFRRNPDTKKVERVISCIVQIKGTLKDENNQSTRKALSVSPLAEGKWFRIRVSETGIHKMSYEQLVSMGMQNPANVRIYGYGGTRLPEDFRKGTQDEWSPLPVFMSKGSDNVFNQGDFILFHAEGPVLWNYDTQKEMFLHDMNPYSDYGYYFLTSDLGEPVFPADAESPAEPANYFTDSYDFRAWYEQDQWNLIQSGQEWYGEIFDIVTQRNFNFNIPGRISDEPAEVYFNLLGRARDSSRFEISANGKLLSTAGIRPTLMGDYTATYAFTATPKLEFKTPEENLNIGLKFIKPDPSASGYLDLISLNARARIIANNSYLYFRDSRSVAPGRITEFSVNGASSGLIVWEITGNNIRQVSYTLNNGIAKFIATSSSLKEYVAFNPSGSFPAPKTDGEGLGLTTNQDIRGSGNPAMVIVAYPDFLPAANRLAEYRRQKNGFSVLVVTPQQVYNEFSSGRPDLTAIRNMMRYFYTSAGSVSDLMPKYLLLFGDASYKLKGTNPNDGNFVPSYQSINSLSPINSFVSDDYFAILDPGEDMFNGLLDLGVGRLPVSSLSQAEWMTDKIIDYEKPERQGDWRNTICFIGDDEDYNIHFYQADQLATYVEDNYPAFNVNKVFLDAYRQVSTPTGPRYPDVNKAINDQINRGALIINYTGHGGIGGLAHEKIMELTDISSWSNLKKLPLFMTATCEFSRYDNPDLPSAGEQVLLSEKGGGIALFTTTRLVYSGPNHALNERFYEIVFQKDAMDRNYCLGEIMKYSKNKTGAGVNKRNFSLLGDPAMRLTYPFHYVKTDTVNGNTADVFSDTLQALRKIDVSGHIADNDGALLDNFNGFVYPVVYDKAGTLSTLANDGGQKQNFTLRNNIIYKGKAGVVNGRFNFSFYVPKDISYATGPGKISYYATSNENDASGAFSDILVGGSYPNAPSDTDGPEIEVYMNNEFFRPGGITDPDPVLFVKVWDEYGINTTGNGIGHDIVGTLNEDSRNAFVLNEYYTSNADSYQSGLVEYPLSGLEEGTHTIRVKVWDIFNNSSEGETHFLVVKSGDLILEKILNYPNPVTGSTWFSFEHNKAGEDLDITIDIFNLSGEIVHTIKSVQYGAGFRSEPIEWNAGSISGNFSTQGVYVYKVRVITSGGKESTGTGKLIILRP